MLSQIASGIGSTLLVTGQSLLFGALLGLPLVAARRSRYAVLRTVATTYINVVRAIPPITWLFLIYFGLPQYALMVDPMTAAVIGFSVISSGYLAEAYRSGLLSISAGQWEAATALGLGFLARSRYIIGPQAFRVTLPIVVAFTIGLLKDSALASTIGVHDMTYQANMAAKEAHNGLQAFCVAGALYIAMSLPLAVVTRRVDRAMRLKVEVV
ncbi:MULTISPECIES: amino acid ABC transporter permease [unclassified Streptomyces]|uniref:amino acid ABC transporter permease n=1 Tax=unclassified Streptomyces TaxID=2593676 RepID=UPI0037226EF4